MTYYSGMTAAEMLRSFKLKYFAAASADFAHIQDTEVMDLLNNAQDRLIRDAVFGTQQERSQGTRVRSKKLTDHDIHTILVKNRFVPTYTPQKGSTSDGHLYEFSSFNFSGTSWEEVPMMDYAVLPEDFRYLRNSRSVVKYVENNDCDPLSKTVVCQDMELQEYVAVVPFIANIEEICTNARADFRIIFPSAPLNDGSHGPVTVFDFADFVQSNGFTVDPNIGQEAKKYKIVELVLSYLNRFNSVSEIVNFDNAGTGESVHIEASNDKDYFQVYWEKYKDQYYQNCFVFVSRERVDVSNNTTLDSGTNPFTDTTYVTDIDYNDSASPGGIDVQITGTSVVDIDATGATPPVITRRFRQKSYCRAVINGVDYSDPLNPGTIDALALPQADQPDNEINTRTSHNRLVTYEDIYQRYETTFSGPSFKHPLVVLGDKYLFIYNKNFATRGVFLDYVRRPRQISIKAAQNCELPEHMHQLVVDEAVLEGLEIIGSPRQQLRQNFENQN